MLSAVPLHLLLAVALGATAIILHEVAHGYAALALGDETALRAGRLTLNPFKHVDRVGTVLLPGVLMLGQLLTVGRVMFMFGWAKPVPVDPTHFRWPRQMMALVALAGPAMNFTLAFLAAHIFRFAGLPAWAVDAVAEFMLFNLVLGLFNLLPMPPLDGGRIMVGLLPRPLALVWARLERFGIVLVMLLLIIPSLLQQNGMAVFSLSSVLMPVVEWAFNAMLWLAGAPDVVA